MKKSIQLLISLVVLTIIIVASLELMPDANDQIPVIQANYSVPFK